jgi:hypothetical protein
MAGNGSTSSTHRRRRTSAKRAVHSAEYVELASTITAAMSARGQTDVRNFQELQNYPQEQPTVTIPNAAEQLELSERQTRRLAPQLGGKKIGGQWLVSQTALVVCPVFS